MRLTIALGAALVLIAPAALAEPVTKRAVFGVGDNTIQARALTGRVSTAPIYKEFFVAYGGRVFVEFKVRSNGAHQVDWEARFGTPDTGFAPCSGFTSSATYQAFGCGADIEAGGILRVWLFPHGQPGAICCARLKFNLVDVNAAAVATQD